MKHKQINFLHDHEPIDRQSLTKKQKRLFFLIGLACIIFILGVIAYALSPVRAPENPDEYNQTTLEPKAPPGLFNKLKHFVFSKDVLLAGERQDRINILLLGQGGPGHDGPYLTDTIIVASIQPSTNDVAMISIPRDLGVDIPGYGWGKINHVNHYGEQKESDMGAAFATEVISDLLNIDIPYYARVDFAAFEEIVDEVGGIKVNVERSFTDYEYPAPGDLYQTISFSKGEQQMDGATSLKYARSRHGTNGEGSDFARARRQQKVLVALKEKLLSFSTLTNPVRIKHIMDSLENHLTTNMEFAEIISFVKLGRELEVHSIKTVVLDNGPDGFLVNSTTNQGAYILSPRTGDFKEIQQLVKHIFDEELDTDIDIIADTPDQESPVIQQANIEVQNGTWLVGLASRTKKVLEDNEFTVSKVGNTVNRPLDTSGVYTVSSPATIDVAQSVADQLNIPFETELPEGISFAADSDVLVILGDDFEE